ncbi:MAG: hypothetical protein KIT80_14625 [Chitinophagaceae bacterium]|nr:hypothetical protein [Chitinophagaceae bacterium]MCW5928149.1 hypothetical protein [Chitinophagaceae bacterium]
MLRYINSYLKVTAACLLLSGLIIICYTAGQFSVLGISVMVLGLLLYITHDMLAKSSINKRYKKVLEFLLAAFICLFCGILLLDYLEVITIEL